MDTSSLFETYLDASKVSLNSGNPTMARIIKFNENPIETKFGTKYTMKIRLEENDEIVTLRVNKTMGITLRKKYGSESELWIGKEIGLYAVPQDIQGRPSIVIKLVV